MTDQLKIKDRKQKKRKDRRQQYVYKTQPYHHQVEALKKMLGQKWGGALLMEPRTGKTKVAIDWFSVLHQLGRVYRAVVICPVSVIGVWEDEIAMHCPFPYRITIWDKDGRKETKLPPWGQNLIDIVIMNYDAFSQPGVLLPSGRRARRGGRFEIRKKIVAWQPHAIILDESHRIKSPRAKKSTMIHSLGTSVPYRLLMTGTVLTKKKRIFDIYSQWLFLNPTSPLVREHTLSTFKTMYGRWTNRNGYPQWLRNRNEIKLKRLLHAESFAVTRDECFDLPPRRSQIVPVELTGHTAQVYDEMAEEMVAQIKTGEITQASIKLVQGLRLSQITSGITKTEPTDERPQGRLVRIGRDKLIVLENLLVDLFEADEHVVIAARWRADIAAIAKMCTALGAATFELHGGIKNRAERDRNRRQFNEHDGPAAFIMQPAAGSEGIDLRSSATFIWFSLTNSWVNFTQAEDRIALSPRGTVYMYLIARGTVDQELYDSNMEDGDLARRITESPDRLLRNFKQAWHPKQRTVDAS